MFGYATDLRSMTKGRASYSMEFECYREVPKHVQEAIVREEISDYNINYSCQEIYNGKRYI